PPEVELIRVGLPQVRRGHAQQLPRKCRIDERVADLVPVRLVLVWREGRGRRDKERGVLHVAPVLVQRDVLEDLVEVPAVPAAYDLPSVADEVVREPDSW